MTVLAKVTDLAQLLKQSQEEPRVALALQRASDDFIGEVGHPVVLVPDDKVLLRGDGSTELFLPARPVTAASVQFLGENITATVADFNNLTADPDRDTVWLDGRLGILSRDSGWPARSRILVTYTHGWPETEIPGDIQDAVLERATHMFHSLGVLSQDSTGPVSRSFVGVTQKWVDVTSRYRVGVGERS